jgi:hypothetical protein
VNFFYKRICPLILKELRVFIEGHLNVNFECFPSLKRLFGFKCFFVSLFAEGKFVEKRNMVI